MRTVSSNVRSGPQPLGQQADETPLRECRPAPGRGVAGSNREDGDLQVAGHRAAASAAAERGRRRPGRPGRSRRRASRRVRVRPVGLRALVRAPRPRRPRPWPLRRELHSRGDARRPGVRRRPVSDRRRSLRGHPAPGDLLQGRSALGRAPHAVAALRRRAARVLHAGARGGHRGCGRRDRACRRRAGGDERARGQRLALPARARSRGPASRPGDTGAVGRLARFLRGPARTAREGGGRQSGPGPALDPAGLAGATRISRGRSRTGERVRPLVRPRTGRWGGTPQLPPRTVPRPEARIPRDPHRIAALVLPRRTARRARLSDRGQA
jgi:hypothetical protein